MKQAANLPESPARHGIAGHHHQHQRDRFLSHEQLQLMQFDGAELAG